MSDKTRHNHRDRRSLSKQEEVNPGEIPGGKRYKNGSRQWKLSQGIDRDVSRGKSADTQGIEERITPSEGGRQTEEIPTVEINPQDSNNWDMFGEVSCKACNHENGTVLTRGERQARLQKQKKRRSEISPRERHCAHHEKVNTTRSRTATPNMDHPPLTTRLSCGMERHNHLKLRRT